MISLKDTSRFESLMSKRERLRTAIIVERLDEELVNLLEKYATLFVLWYEYKKGIKLDVKDGLLKADYEKGTVKLNKNIEEAIDGLLDDIPLREYSVGYEGWEVESRCTFRELYDNECRFDYQHALYFLADNYALFRNTLEVISMRLANFECDKVEDLERWCDRDTTLRYCFKNYDTPIEASVVYLRDNFSFQPMEGKGIRVLKDSDAFGITLEGKHYVVFNGTELFEAKLNEDDVYICESIDAYVNGEHDLWNYNYNCVVNDRYLFMYADSVNCVFGIDLESDADVYHTKFYDLHRVNDKKLLSLIKRTKLLNGGMN